jgi:alkaline phosphatase D
MKRKKQDQLSRRHFLLGSAIAGSGIVVANLRSKSGLAQSSAPAIITSDRMRPSIPYGVASGDITGNSAVIWSRCDRSSRMIVEYDTADSFGNVQRIIGPAALETSDYTARINLIDLPADRQIFYRVSFQNLADPNIYSVPVTGVSAHLQTASATSFLPGRETPPDRVGVSILNGAA